MARKKKMLGEFHHGAYVRYSTYGMGGSLHHLYGKVTRIDLERSIVVWRILGSKKKPWETRYDTIPKKNVASSWHMSVVKEEDVPESWRPGKK